MGHPLGIALEVTPSLAYRFLDLTSTRPQATQGGDHSLDTRRVECLAADCCPTLECYNARSVGGAPWVWGIAPDHFSGAIQIVDLYHAREHLANLDKLL